MADCASSRGSGILRHGSGTSCLGVSITALVAAIVLSGCSVRPSKAVIRDAVNTHLSGSDTIQSLCRQTGNFFSPFDGLQSVKVTNRYARTVDGDKITYCEYLARIRLVAEMSGDVPLGEKTVDGTVALVKRGNEWRLLRQSEPRILN